MASKLAPPPKVSHGHTRYPPIGRCIYCPNTTGPFTDEHIVPKGLGGTWLLEKASCLACQKITCDFEGVVQGHMLGNYRICVGLSKSHKNAETVEIEFLDKNKRSKIETVAISDAPIGISLPGFHPAHFFETRPLDHSHLRATWFGTMNWDFQEQSERHDRHGFLIGDLKPKHFARMIAKIAHSFAVAEFGFRFQPLLSNIIRTGQQDYRYWIGCDPMRDDAPTKPGFHQVGYSWTIRDNMVWPIINIQLFAQYRAPIYHALVGPMPLSAIRPK